MPPFYLGTRRGLIYSRKRSVGLSSPLEVSGCVLWHDANQITGLNDGDKVSQWDDLSVNLSHATQAAAANKPLYKTGIINGKPVVRFVGATPCWLLQPLNINGAKTVFMVFKLTTLPGAATTTPLNTKHTTPSLSEILFTQIGGYTEITFRDDITGSALSVGFSPGINTSPHIFVKTYNGVASSNPTSYTARYDKAAATVIASGSLNRTLTNKGAVGARVSSTDVPGSAYNGDIAEIIIYSSVLAGVDQLAVETYLANKYSL